MVFDVSACSYVGMARPTEAQIEGFRLTTRDVAAYFNVREDTVRQWRMRGTGPHFVKLNNKVVRYCTSAILDFASSNPSTARLSSQAK